MNSVRDYLNDPLTRTILGTGVGGLFGTLYGLSDKSFPMNSEDEKIRKALAYGVRGAILGTGVAHIPTLLNINY